MSAPQRGSNMQFQAGGLYPGGVGVIRDIYYKLWDYNGRQAPNSQMCVECIFAPMDGSNEGKDVTINWNVGSAENYQPDPQHAGFFLSGFNNKTAMKLIDSSNWHFALETGFVKNCGLPDGSLDGPNGIKALIGSELTLVRMDPPKRDFRDDGGQQQAGQQGQGPQGQQQRVNQILVPTRAKWAWEKGGKPIAPGAAATAASAASNSSSSGSDLASIMQTIVQSEGGAIDMADFNKKLLDLCNARGIKGKERVALTKASKDKAQMTAASSTNNYTFDDFNINADGTMSGTLSA